MIPPLLPHVAADDLVERAPNHADDLAEGRQRGSTQARVAGRGPEELEQGRAGELVQADGAVARRGEDVPQAVDGRMLRPDVAVRLGLAPRYYADEVVYRLEEELPVSLAQHVGQALAEIMTNDAGRRRRGEVYDLEYLLLQVQLLRGAVVGGEGEDVLAQARDECEDVELVLLGRERLELGDVELRVRRRGVVSGFGRRRLRRRGFGGGSWDGSFLLILARGHDGRQRISAV